MASTTSAVEAAKRAAAFAAVDAHVRGVHRYIGIGSGSTVPYAVERIVAQGTEANRNRWFIPTGFQSRQLILDGGLNLADIQTCPELDVVIDGADEVDNALNLIKGGGACHLQEKVVAFAAKEMIVVADYRKRSKILGTKWTKGIPVEVAPVAASQVLASLKRLGSVNATIRMAKEKAGPVVTDNGFV